MYPEGIISLFSLSFFSNSCSNWSLKWIPSSYLEAHHQSSHMYNSFIMAVYNPVPFNTTLNRKWCGENKSNYSAIQHQKPCLQRGLQRTGPRNKHRRTRAACLEIGQRGGTLTAISCFYTVIFTLIINHLTIERGKKKHFYITPQNVRVWHICTFILDNEWEWRCKW